MRMEYGLSSITRYKRKVEKGFAGRVFVTLYHGADRGMAYDEQPIGQSPPKPKISRKLLAYIPAPGYSRTIHQSPNGGPAYDYIVRNLESVVKQVTKEYPVVLVTGPRQAGKTTMLKHLMDGTDRGHSG